jgi:hypothetical protein
MTLKKILLAAFFSIGTAAVVRAADELPLSITTADYPHIDSIKNGQIKIPECRINYTTASIAALMQRFDQGAVGDIIEVDFATCLKRFSSEKKHDWVLIPIYLWREFPQRHMVMNNGELGVDVPSQSMIMWARGIAASSPTLKIPLSDSKTVEQDYFHHTRIFPIMTVLAVRSELVKENPWLPEALFIAFSEAKSQALEAGTIPLPWGSHSREETEALMKRNYWSYGVRNNPKTLSTLFKYAHEQGLTDKVLKADDVFAPETLSLIDEKGAKN